MMLDYSITDLLLGIALTGICYVGPPVVYSFAVRKGQITKKAAKNTCIISGIVIYLIFFFLSAYLEVEGAGTIYPAVIWSVVAYKIISPKTAKDYTPDTQKADRSSLAVEEQKADEDIPLVNEAPAQKKETVIPKNELMLLKQLHDKGVLTDEEFKEKKKKLLNL